MTISEFADKLATQENRDAYETATDKAIFVQNLIEAGGVATYPMSPLCEYVECALSQ